MVVRKWVMKVKREEKNLGYYEPPKELQCIVSERGMGGMGPLPTE